MTPDISIIIVNYNSGGRLQKCLTALAAQTFRDFEIIIVDNDSADGSLGVSPPDGVDTRILKLDDNIGFAGANNRGVEQARGAWVAFLNPDAYAAPGWLEAFIDGRARYCDVDAFGSLQLIASDPARIDGAGDAYFAAGISYRSHFNHSVQAAPPEGECFAPCAAAAFYRKEVFEQLGGFEETFFCYAEDVDLAFRLRLKGGRVIQLRNAVVHHEGSGITSQVSGFAVYHGHRNRLWTYFRNMPPSLLIITLPAQVIMSLLLIPVFFFKGCGGAYVRGVWDGVAALPKVLKGRTDIQRTRKVSTSDLVHVITWSPIKFLQRRAGRI